jgi:large subunit ribosomal protein L18e
MYKNNQLKELIHDLRKASVTQDVGVWAAVAEDLERATRKHAAVNLSVLARSTKQGEIIIVPGKVLGDGEIAHALTIAALGFSQNAQSKLKASKATIMTIKELVAKDPKGKTVRIFA